MDTLSHGFWTYILFWSHSKKSPIVIGAVVPDISIILLILITIMSGDFSYRDPWLPQILDTPLKMTIDSAFHSVTVWSVVFFGALLLNFPFVYWMGLGVFLHLLFDILTHQDLIPSYFWPFTTLKIVGPFDYLSLAFTVVNFTLIAIFVGLRLGMFKKKLR